VAISWLIRGKEDFRLGTEVGRDLRPMTLIFSPLRLMFFLWVMYVCQINDKDDNKFLVLW